MEFVKDNKKPFRPKDFNDRRTQRDKEIVAEYMKQRDMPAWYRGISAVRHLAAESLHYSLRDDIGEDSIYRTRETIAKMGLMPMVTDKRIKLLIRISRGNDLAFLWFLWELAYKTPGDSYSINEQLLLTYIAHLDTITTLRELDHILPPPQPAKRQLEREHSTALKSELTETKSNRARKVHKKEALKLPYFQKPTKPIYAPSNKYIRRPDFMVSFDGYDNYADPYYKVPNEATRWYANYELSSPSRVARRLVREEIDRVPWLSDGYDWEKFQNLIEGTEREEEKAMCIHHKEADKMQQAERDEKLVAKREYCRAYFNPREAKNKRRQQLAHENLEKDAERILRSPGEQDDFAWVNVNCCEKLDKDKHNSACKGMARFLQRTGARACGAQECDMCQKSPKKFCPTEPHPDCEHCHATKDESEKFFTATTTHLPYMFDHDKIFNFEIEPTTEQDIKKKVIEALSYTDVTEERRKVTKEAVYEEAVTKTAQKIWKEQVEAHQAKLESLAAMQKRENSRAYDVHQIRQKELGFEKDYYDPDDAELMATMLKKTLAYMAKNPKFVLASMPEAHKWPILRYWMAQRYGRRYTYKERCELLRKDQKIFYVLRHMLEPAAPYPTDKALGTTIHTGWLSLKYPVELKEKGKQMRETYNNLLHNYMMTFNREFYTTMRAPLCSGGYARSTFFDYMPIHQADTQHYNLWKSPAMRDVRLIRQPKEKRGRHQFSQPFSPNFVKPVIKKRSFCQN